MQVREVLRERAIFSGNQSSALLIHHRQTLRRQHQVNQSSHRSRESIEREINKKNLPLEMLLPSY